MIPNIWADLQTTKQRALYIAKFHGSCHDIIGIVGEI